MKLHVEYQGYVNEFVGQRPTDLNNEQVSTVT